MTLNSVTSWSGPPTSSSTFLTSLSAPSGFFYTDQGATLVPVADRMFVGGASLNPGTAARSNADWLSAVMAPKSVGAWATNNAQFAALTETGGSIGILGGAQTVYANSAIGIGSWAIVNDPANLCKTAWAYYGEAWQTLAGVTTPSYCMELEAVNFVAAPSSGPTPWQTGIGGGLSCLQLGAGGGNTYGTFDVQSCINIINNPNKFQVGILIGASALTGLTSGVGYGTAMALPPNAGIEWRTTEVVAFEGSNYGFRILSSVTLQAQGSTILATNGGLEILNGANSLAFSFNTSEATASTGSLTFSYPIAGSPGGITVNNTGAGNANLLLSPAAGGLLAITATGAAAPVGVGAAMPTTAAEGFLPVSINGTTGYIAIHTLGQT